MTLDASSLAARHETLKAQLNTEDKRSKEHQPAPARLGHVPRKRLTLNVLGKLVMVKLSRINAPWACPVPGGRVSPPRASRRLPSQRRRSREVAASSISLASLPNQRERDGPPCKSKRVQRGPVGSFLDDDRS